ncbi:MAG: sigma-70 family RNA polymerase sigma factor [Blastocatellia bacterium]|nr:sigma-70 family RNA polymerase sigma factor [Blastocatellia bacterium]
MTNAMELSLMVEEQKNREEARDATAQLIRRAQAGDSTAFDQLVLAHQRRTLALAWRLLGNAEDARDAAQEAFLRAFRHLGRFDASLDFAGWFYRIIVNACNDLARKRGNRFSSFEAALESGALAEPASPRDTESEAMAAQEQTRILKALAQLTEKERAAIVLRDLEGLPTEEVARILGSSPTTVRSQISSARTKLKAFREKR